MMSPLSLTPTITPIIAPQSVLSVFATAVAAQDQAGCGAEARENGVADDGAGSGSEECVARLVRLVVGSVVRVRLAWLVVAARGRGVVAVAVAVAVV